MAIVGVDIGLSGFAALIYGMDNVAFYPAPTISVPGTGKQRYDLRALVELVKSWKEAHVINLVMLESQQAFPGQGGVANFSIGYGYAAWKTALTAVGLPFDEVRPIKWKKALGINIGGKDKSAKKRAAIEKAQSLWPGVSLIPTEAKAKARVSSPDKAEALLIATYAHRLLGAGVTA